jgi:hypothetical protein
MDAFTRAWNEAVASLIEHFPGGLVALVLIALVLCGILAAILFWLTTGRGFGSGRGGRGGRGGRLGLGLGSFRLRWRWRWPWRRRKRAGEPDVADLPPDELPDLPAATLVLSADEYAAAGRFAEAVRERLRAIVRDLVEREVITHRPGWTVTELAGAAATAIPAAAAPLNAATAIFSEIWYGQRTATATDDRAMRAHASTVRAAPPVGPLVEPAVGAQR